jgi:DNA-binding winged helix-turn-helix (wHTH) protein/TolB-like protein/Tfp pilus assembly protein PilF
MHNEINYLYAFGKFTLLPQQRLLLRQEKPVSITPKAFELLVALVTRSGKLVEKNELLSVVWPDVSVEEGNLAVMISQLRKVLGDDRGKHEYIETVSKYGYRFVASVTQQVVPVEKVSPVLVVSPQLQEPAEKLKSGALTLILEPLAGDQGRGRSWNRAVGWIFSAGIAISVLLFTGRFVMLKSEAHSLNAQPAPIHSLAVLPFRVTGASEGDEFWGDGVADALVTKLGNIDSIVVRPIGDLEKYKKSSLSPIDMGTKEGVDAVLAGRIQRVGDRVRLTVQLLQVRDGTELWADVFDERLTDIFTLEDRVSDRVVQSLQIKLTNAKRKRITTNLTGNALAYQAYVKGRYFWNKRTNEGLQKGLQYFREAIRLDPGFAEAYEGVADSYAALGLYAVMSPEDAFPAARDAAQKALEMDDNLADAHATLGLILFYYNWDALAAENEFHRALQINPNYAMAHSWNAEVLAAMGRFPEASDEAKRALAEDPLSQIIASNAGWALCLAGQTDAAIETLKKAIEMDPEFPRTHFRLGSVYQSRGWIDAAIQEYQKAIQLSDNDPYYQASLANAYAVSGHGKEAASMLKSLSSRSAHQHVPAFAFAVIYAGMNEKNAAFQWLGKTAADHSTSMAYAKVDPDLTGLRSDPRFAAVLKTLNF